uniref:Uncharacterized protein n=1 Tax=Rhizophora mucronata TaxID=61149 RepID=A0A2P2PYB3_RHIMU
MCFCGKLKMHFFFFLCFDRICAMKGFTFGAKAVQ